MLGSGVPTRGLGRAAGDSCVGWAPQKLPGQGGRKCWDSAPSRAAGCGGGGLVPGFHRGSLSAFSNPGSRQEGGKESGNSIIFQYRVSLSLLGHPSWHICPEAGGAGPSQCGPPGLVALILGLGPGAQGRAGISDQLGPDCRAQEGGWGLGARLLYQMGGEEASLLHHSPVLALHTPWALSGSGVCTAAARPTRQDGVRSGEKGTLSSCSVIWAPSFLRSLTSDAPSLGGEFTPLAL